MIRYISGTALSFDRVGCGILQRDGWTQHERFAGDCFDERQARLEDLRH
jgi:hypothetical protein